MRIKMKAEGGIHDGLGKIKSFFIKKRNEGKN